MVSLVSLVNFLSVHHFMSYRFPVVTNTSGVVVDGVVIACRRGIEVVLSAWECHDFLPKLLEEEDERCYTPFSIVAKSKRLTAHVNVKSTSGGVVATIPCRECEFAWVLVWSVLHNPLVCSGVRDNLEAVVKRTVVATIEVAIEFMHLK